ncbi:nitroreductase [Flavobacteriales bacterium]|nr:nitroreductase [Flavobacteriales bacterium]MDC0015283.1 nitroreductase [Flavobacteriales bacterium]MDC1371115.1 nitroreductase [Flavobacteriales bacterium]MDG1175220.1 nitroreductase [Flavobacteriales bacterium]
MKYNLSEITEVIRNRRTIYPEQYSDRKIHREIVEDILNNAIWAPTHGNTQPWRFMVYMEDSKIELSDFLSGLYKEKFTGEDFNEAKYNKLKNRPLKSSVAIALVMSREPDGKIIELEEIEAVSCAVQNMYLTCTAYGIGGFWSTPKLAYGKEMHEFLELKEGEKCLGVFYMGYPAIDWPKGQRKPIEYSTTWK